MSDNLQRYHKLERRLVLLAWLNRHFGFEDNEDFLKSLAEADNGFDDAGMAFVTARLLSRGSKCRLSRDTLARYDANIGRHLAAINRKRTRPIVLRYFQHLALLYTEIYLDRYFHDRANLLAELNLFVDDRNIDKLPGDIQDARFTDEELGKVAFWMATGSGKTLIFHINYHQFRHYAREARQPIDNILLITPNDNLTTQHLQEMQASGIPCARFSLEESGLGMAATDAVRVLEITKLVSEKKGSGLSVPVEAFEGHNLVFVDEGHKGTGSEAETWRNRRLALGRGGFTFEYSATFGQALDATKKDAVTEEYAKSILFDYSYKYFYRDGFGKDFHILNLKDYQAKDDVHTLLLANLLSFYEQRLYFQENQAATREYLLEPPLWLLVCSRVSAKNAEVVTVLEFLARFLPNAKGWAVKKIGEILRGKSGIESEDGQDMFAGHLPYLRRGKLPDPEKVFEDILRRVFLASSPGELEIRQLTSTKNEVALRAAGTETYFGVIVIGSVNDFKKVVEAEAPQLSVSEDSIQQPLFPKIKHASSPQTLLIGAKMFMEGWSSWRVANIGLLNVGVSEGSEIIQLFGRGVRLKGYAFDLKRSSEVKRPDGGGHPAHLKVLERLNIFAVRANYMARFRDYLEREGVNTGGFLEMELPLWTNKEFLKEDLYRPRLPKDRRFDEEVDLLLAPSDKVRVRLDAATRVHALQSQTTGGVHEADGAAGHSVAIETTALSLLDWTRLHLDLLEYKQTRGYRNLTVPVSAPREILFHSEPRLYELVAPEEWVKPDSADNMARLQGLASSLLKKYLERFYQQARQSWESEQMTYETLKVADENFQPYRVSVPRGDPKLVEEIHAIIEEAKKLSGKSKPEGIYAGDMLFDVPNVHFDRHLYQPLLVSKKDGSIKTSPPLLEESEKRFVEDLKSFCRAEAGKALRGKELFLLRNLGRGKGIGFFESRGFYPDFILWIKERGKQRIIFIEPHGLMHEPGGPHSEKIGLHLRLREHSRNALKVSTLKHLTVDAFVVSRTPYFELTEIWKKDDGSRRSYEEFACDHVLFQERRDGYDYIRAIVAG